MELCPSLNYIISDPNSSDVISADGIMIRLKDISAVWYRRPTYPRIPQTVFDPDDREFAQHEWRQSLDGLFMCLCSLQTRLVNSPLHQMSAGKPRQLEIARHCGLRIPDTLITNDPDRVKDFLHYHGGKVVHKAITAPRHRFLDTRLRTDKDNSAIQEFPLTPTIFQEYISGQYDVRTTIVGNDIFAARISTANGRSGIDSRLDIDVPYKQQELPSGIYQSLIKLMQKLGLTFGTIDLKITDSDEYVFFEVNPQGQFLYIEILTGMPITSALAHFLAHNQS
jgi:glutathione synthase/RimK-type ligase-like ATP-grasp enzyme